MPCTLLLPSGYVTLHLANFPAWREHVTLPARPVTILISRQRRGRVAAGLALLGVAGLATSGIVAIAATRGTSHRGGYDDYQPPTDNSDAILGGVLLGTVSLGTLIPGLICGLDSERDGAVVLDDEPSSPGPSLLRPTLIRSGSSAGFGFSF
jgi:hypothetical protein